MAYTIKSINQQTFDIVASFDVDNIDQTINVGKECLEDSNILTEFLTKYEAAYKQGLEDTAVTIDPSLQNLVQ